MKIQNILREVKDKRGKQGKLYPAYALLCLILVSRLCGYKDIKSAWRLSQSLHYKQLHQLGFKKHYNPSYPVFTETLKSIDIDSLESCLYKLAKFFCCGKEHLSIDGKGLSGRKRADGSAYHLVSLFCNSISHV